MNEYQQALMDKPSLISDYCIFCGRVATEQHHIVPRSQGGTDGPTVSVCGWGNADGCHGLLHDHKLHLAWDEKHGCWKYLYTGYPVKYEKALQKDGWKPLLYRKTK